LNFSTMMHRPYTAYAPPLPAQQQPSSRTTMPTYSTSSLPPRTQAPQVQQQQQQQQQPQQQMAGAGGAYMRQNSSFSFGNTGSLGNGMGLRTSETVHGQSSLTTNRGQYKGRMLTLKFQNLHVSNHGNDRRFSIGFK
jgi:hypothetical protein